MSSVQFVEMILIDHYRWFKIINIIIDIILTMRNDTFDSTATFVNNRDNLYQLSVDNRLSSGSTSRQVGAVAGDRGVVVDPRPSLTNSNSPSLLHLLSE